MTAIPRTPSTPKTTASTSGTAWRSTRRFATLAGGALLFWSSAAAAEPKLDCPTQSEEAQRLRDKQRYGEARDLFQRCSASTCPSVVRKDCAKWLVELDESMPTIVVAAQDGGQDLADATVKVDGKVLTTRLDGRALALDPGEHTLTVESATKKVVTQKIIARVNEKNRLVRIDFTAPKPEATAPKPESSPKSDGAEEEARAPVIPLVSWVLGGVGVAGLASFAIFGLIGKGELNDLKGSTGCAPFCQQSELDGVKSTMLVADVSLGVGIVALGAAAVIAIVSRSNAKPAQTAALRW